MKALKIAVAVVVVVVAALWVVGAALPAEHTASRAAQYRQSPETLWKDITDVDGFASWRTDLTSVRRLLDEDGKSAWVEVTGGDEMPMRVEESSPQSRLVTRITDPSLPFGGTWTFEITPVERGATLRITEDGFVRPALFRVLSRYVFGHTATIDQYLTALGQKHGEMVTIVN